MKNIISADYIRGFADGEGCFSGYALSMSNTELLLLEQIKQALTQWDIKSQIGPHGQKPQYTPIFRLQITGYPNLKSYQENIGFGHPKKRQLLAEYIAKMEKPGALHNREEANQAMIPRQLGYSYRDIAKHLGILKGTIAQRFRRGIWPLEKI